MSKAALYSILNTAGKGFRTEKRLFPVEEAFFVTSFVGNVLNARRSDNVFVADHLTFFLLIVVIIKALACSVRACISFCRAVQCRKFSRYLYILRFRYDRATKAV